MPFQELHMKKGMRKLPANSARRSHVQPTRSNSRSSVQPLVSMTQKRALSLSLSLFLSLVSS